MLDADKRTQKDLPSHLAQWIYLAIGHPEVEVKVRLQGNNLHVLCQSNQTLEAHTVVNRLIRALKSQGEGAKWFSETGNLIYKIIVYGRSPGQKHPNWVKQIGIKTPPLGDKLGQSKAQTLVKKNKLEDSSLTFSQESLTGSGSAETIAHDLSEVLSPLGISVRVVIQNGKSAEALSPNPDSLNSAVSNRRLWLFCNSNYSPDQSLLAPPLVEKLRSLQLEGFRDAGICAQVSGEAKPEWLLRVDLTPPEAMLNDWARWGDIQAIALLLNQGLQAKGIEIRACQKDTTLHLFCSLSGSGKVGAPDKQMVMEVITPLLDQIAPQGIQAASVFGVASRGQEREQANSQADNQWESDGVPLSESEKPLWLEWQKLPAAENRSLAQSANSLAQQGNQTALTFLLEKLLNPNLERRLATGGIQVKVRRKQDLLHVMSEATFCPAKAQVARPIACFLRQLAIPTIAGIRVYGRQAGSSSSAWNYGVDFTQRRRLVPEASPEFAASDAYISELVNTKGEPVLRQDLSEEELIDSWRRGVEGAVTQVRRWLCYSQLFVPVAEHQDLSSLTKEDNQKTFSTSEGVKVALVWGTLSLLITVQADWLIGQLLRSNNNFDPETGRGLPAEAAPLILPQLSLRKGSSQESDDFDTAEFTKEGKTRVVIGKDGEKLLTPERQGRGSATLAAARSSLPSFNNRLLDEQLALYQQRLEEGKTPDVLVMGSSRALRGVDPTALQNALKTQGYSQVEVFNFGVNGATAQVVELLLRQILLPEQLPKLIIWADGSRAFNSGRVDATYNAIATSEAYREIKAGTFPLETELGNSSASPRNQPLISLSEIHQQINQQLNQSLAKVSSTYSQKDQFKSWLRERFVTLMANVDFSQPQRSEEFEEVFAEQASIDIDGFLPVSVRFNPATYYQKHPRVAGSYDSNYQSFQLSGKQDAALEEIVQFTKEQGIGLVFVNLPLTNEYLDPVRTEYEQKFQRHMHSSALERGLIFRDLSDLLLTQYDYFSDPSHLNRYGAYKVSQHLAQDPMIPWSLVISNK
ncbi:MAG: DUF1574 family protein [Coleofasciculaceae cyanobacterium]